MPKIHDLLLCFKIGLNFFGPKGDAGNDQKDHQQIILNLKSKVINRFILIDETGENTAV